MSYYKYYEDMSDWYKSEKNNESDLKSFENLSLADKARRYQSLIKDDRLEKIIKKTNEKILSCAITYKNLNSQSISLDYSNQDLLEQLIEYYEKEGFKVKHEKCLTEENFHIEW